MRKLWRVLQGVAFQETIICTIERKTLNLNKKTKLTNFAKKNCQKLGEISGTGKTSVASILKDEENMGKEFEMFEGKHFIRNLIK